MTTKITATLIKRIEADPHMQGLELPIKTLETILEKAIDAYYNSDKPFLTDATYDILWQCLEERDAGNEILKKVGAPVSKEDKVKLPYYEQAVNGKFNPKRAEALYEDLVDELVAGGLDFEQIEFQELMGKIEVLGELLIKSKGLIK